MSPNTDIPTANPVHINLPSMLLAIPFHQQLLASTMFFPVGLARQRSFSRFAIKEFKRQAQLHTERRAREAARGHWL